MQWETLSAGGMRETCMLIIKAVGVMIVSGRPPKRKDQLKAYEVYVIVSGGDPRTLKFLLSFHTGSIFLEHHFYLIRKQVPLKCPPKLSRCS